MKILLIEKDKKEREGFIPDEEPLYVPFELPTEKEVEKEREEELVPA